MPVLFNKLMLDFIRQNGHFLIYLGHLPSRDYPLTSSQNAVKFKITEYSCTEETIIPVIWKLSCSIDYKRKN